MSHKLGIVVPYRNRYKQLIHFKKAIQKHFSESAIEYVLIVVEQDDSAAFNRGKLLNAGAIKALELNCDYVVFHDVDMIPVDVDYSFSEVPIHLASNFVYGYNDSETSSIHFEQYFGGVTLFPLDVFQAINGYSNEYWGWGFEDDDLFYRTQKLGVATDFKEEVHYVSSTASVKFNGASSFVELENTIDYTKDFTIHISFNPEHLVLDHTKDVDRYTIFSVPGYDFNLFYSSFKRYSVEAFDKRGNIYTITSEIKNPKQTKATVIWKSKYKKLRFYLDDELVGEEQFEHPLYNYSKYKSIYIGCSNRVDGAFHDINYFKGGVDCFALFDLAIQSKEVRELANNKSFGLGTNFGDYKSADNLNTYYDAKVIRHYKLVDLSLQGNDGTLTDCWFEPTNYTEYKNTAIPFRRQCTFRLLDHKPGGYLNGRWKDQLTRYNQLKFVNETLPGYRNTTDDGLNSCDFKLISETKGLNYVHITVKL